MLCGRDAARLQQAAAEISAATGNTPQWTVAWTSATRRPSRISCRRRCLPSAACIPWSTTAAVRRPAALTSLMMPPGSVPTSRTCSAVYRTIRAPPCRTCVTGHGGRIVNFASTSVKSPIDNLILSNTFRTGVLGLSKSLAAELAADGILVNLVGPGRITTARTDQLDATARAAGRCCASNRSTMRPAGISRCVATASARRNFAKIAVFLGSPVNTYITGQTLLVDGGMVKAY